MIRKITSSFAIAIILSILTSTTAIASRSCFPVYYAIVKNLKGDEAHFEEFMDLYDLAPKTAEHLSTFWWHKTLAYCKDQKERARTQKIAEWKKKNPDKVISSDDQTLISKEVIEKISPCIESYIYDNWNEINQSILTRHRQITHNEN